MPPNISISPLCAILVKWAVTFLISFTLLFFGVLIVDTSASFRKDVSHYQKQPQYLQAQVTPTATVQVETTSRYTFSLSMLGYDDTTLTSPGSAAQYYFRLPETWLVENAVLELDLSYVYSQIDAGNPPVLLGDLTVKLDGQTLRKVSIDEVEINHRRLRIPIPLSYLNNPDQTQHSLELLFDAGYLCEIPHKASLVIHPNTFISLDYDQRSPILDLSQYPRPFFQRSFEPDIVRFVLPQQSTPDVFDSSLGVAAKLGNLTNGRLVISATTDIDIINLLTTATLITDNHFIVIGQPQNNRLIPLLNRAIDLPVSLHQQQLNLTAQGPGAIAAGDTFTYLFTATNTLGRNITVTVISSFPSFQSELIGCTPNCNIDTNSSIVWESINIAEDEKLYLSLTLKASDTLTGNIIENTLTVIETDFGPIAAETLTATVAIDTTNYDVNISTTQEDDYFFLFSGHAVPYGDGVIQEILSPWNESRAILIITGLDNEAVKKASQAMSSETHFPGMSGAVAFVQDVSSPDSQENNVAALSDEVTFAELGYSDRVVQGGRTSQQLEYFFEIPSGWQLTDEAALFLDFGHSQLVDYQNSSLTVFLNNQPVSGISFNDETSGSGQVIINLADAKIRPGENRLALAVNVSIPGKCVDSSQAWVLIKDTSTIFMPHSSNGESSALDFRIYPKPFNLNSNLTDLLFAMPLQPTIDEWEIALQLASRLGSSVEGVSTLPIGSLGEDELPENVSNYQIIAVGRPTRNELIQQVNIQLPQPFLRGSDQIDQRLENITFRLEPDADLGYAQLLPSPWNKDNALLVVTGTTDQGVRWVLDALRRRNLEGNLVLAKEDRINTLDTRNFTSGSVVLAVATATAATISETVRVVTVTVTATPALISNPGDSASVQTSNNLPSWLFPLVGVNGLVVVFVIAFVFWQRVRIRR